VPETLLAARRFALLKRAMVAASGPGVFSPTDLDRYVEAWSRPGALPRCSPGIERSASSVLWTADECFPPVLVIWGERDPFLDRRLYRASLDRCADGQGLVLADAGPLAHLEVPAVVEQETSRFIGAT
jgi:pimeloyl-ACP methyl ester carboxylesterase